MSAQEKIDLAIGGAFNSFNYDDLPKEIGDMCSINPERCASFPKHLMEACEKYRKEVKNCYETVRDGVEKFCAGNKSSPACDWLPTTTGSNIMLPIIIGCSVGAIVIIAIGIALFFYCRKKKKLGAQGKSMAGSTAGDATNSGTTNEVTTKTGSRY